MWKKWQSPNTLAKQGGFWGFSSSRVSELRSDGATAGPAHRLNHRELDISSTEPAKVARGKTSPSISTGRPDRALRFPQGKDPCGIPQFFFLI